MEDHGSISNSTGPTVSCFESYHTIYDTMHKCSGKGMPHRHYDPLHERRTGKRDAKTWSGTGPHMISLGQAQQLARPEQVAICH